MPPAEKRSYLRHPYLYLVPAISGSIYRIRFLCLHSLSIFVLSGLVYLTASAQVKGEIPELEVGRSVEREMAGSEVHSFSIKLVTGQYLSATLQQKGMDVLVSIFHPDGKLLIKVDYPNATDRPKLIFLLAEASGPHRIEISGVKEGASGGYTLKIEELREATSADRKRIEAERLFAEASSVTENGEAKYLAGAVEKFDKAIIIFREIGNSRRETSALNILGLAYSRLGNKKKALENHQQSLLLAHASGDMAAQAKALENTGRAFNDLGEGQKSLQSFKEMLAVNQAANNRRGQVTALNYIGLICADLGEKQDAIDSYNQALLLVRGASDHQDEIRLLLNSGRVHDDFGDKDKALDTYAEALKISKATGDLRRT
jgi:tetratricopeptide (TPR) repeat protein